MHIRKLTARAAVLAAASVALVALGGCSSDDNSMSIAPSATPTRTGSPTPTQTSTRSSTPTDVPATATPTATSSSTVSSTPTLTATSTSTVTPTALTDPTTTPTPDFVVGSCDDPAVQATEPLCDLDHATVNCDFLIPEKCLLPYPSSVFLRPDATTPTGYRLNYSIEAMPVNLRGIPVDPKEWNTLDGFSPGPIIEALFPEGVDLAASGVPPITNFARSLEEDSPTVLIDAETGERVPHFTELDDRAHNVATQMFLIRPGVRLKNATRYIVAIRGLVNREGGAIAPRRAFQILRDNLETPVETINARRASFEDIFSRLESAGVQRSSLILAWDFVTASSESLTGRALSVRDQGLAAVGEGAPSFTVTSIEEDVDENILRRVRGTYEVPLFMTSATPPAYFSLDENGVPRQNGTTTAPFTVMIPRSTTADATAHPARPIVYGHGLLGSGEGEVGTGHLRSFANQYNFVLAATDWVGMSEDDFTPTIMFVDDLSNFHGLPDRLHQAMLNFILLGRLMIAADGFVSHPAFQLDGAPLIDTQALYYYGISQGGIEGGAYLALSPDTTRGVLGVGAENYSILLQRSQDFPQFEFVLNQKYPDPLDQQLLFPIIQQLWDRAEPQGYLPHLIENLLPGSRAKKVLLQVGINDSQVPNIGTEIQVRSLGIPAIEPSVVPWFQVPELAAPFDGSALALYDVNATPAPLTNRPPSRDNGVHEAVRRLDAARRQIDAFLRPDGTIQNFCEGPCFFTDVPGVDQRE